LSKKELDAIFERKAKKTKQKKRKPSNMRIKKKEEPKKEEEPKTKRNDKDSIYKKYFTGRFSISSRQASTLMDFGKLVKP
jgi:hypothetical protein